MTETTKIILPGERPMSLNKFYSGQHWKVRSDEVERVQTVVRSALTGNETPYQQRVNIVVTAYFDKRPLDASNVMGKIYEDSLKGWLIVDDSPRYVRSMTTVSEVDRSNPRVEIEIQEANP